MLFICLLCSNLIFTISLVSSFDQPIYYIVQPLALAVPLLLNLQSQYLSNSAKKFHKLSISTELFAFFVKHYFCNIPINDQIGALINSAF